MAEKGTYSDPRCYACGPKPYHVGRFERAVNRAADWINEHIPAPEIENPDVLQLARSE